MAGWAQLPLIFLRIRVKRRSKGRKTGNRGEKGGGQEGASLEDRKQMIAGWEAIFNFKVNFTSNLKYELKTMRCLSLPIKLISEMIISSIGKVSSYW